MELCTLAQSVQSQLGLESEMAKAINAGEDLHRKIAARITGKREVDVTPEERQRAKAINFGKPGGMGGACLQQYARTSYGVDLDDRQVEALSEAWFDTFPEMHPFLEKDCEMGEVVATLLNLTPLTHFEHTGSRKYLDHPENIGKENQPHSILGWMCLKTLQEPAPATRQGELYDAGIMDYFWCRLQDAASELPRRFQMDITNRQPSWQLRRAVRNRADHAPVFTLTGRLRAGASFSERHNTVFQGDARFVHAIEAK